MKILRMALLAAVGLGAALVLYSCNQILQDNRQQINAAVSTASDAAQVLIWSGTFGLSVTLVLTPIVGFWWLWHKRRERSLRQEDGSFALQEIRHKGRRIFVDPNRTVEPVVTVVPKLGAIIQHEPAAGYERQAQQNLAVQGTRTMEAMVTGDNAAASRYGRDFRPARVLTAGMMNAATKTPKLPEALPVDPDLLPAPEHEASLPQIMDTAKPNVWPIGYSPETGEVAKVLPQEHIHVLIVGATGAGKTKSAAYHVATYAARNRWHLILLDGKGGLDWREFEEWGEWHMADATTIARQANALAKVHNSRLALCRQHNVSEIHKIPQAQRPPEILVVIEELGAIMSGMAGMVKEKKYTEATLGKIVATGRATGLHFMAITTTIRDWPAAFQSNAGIKVVYRMGENQGSAVSIYDKRVERLKRGQFMLAGEPGAVFHSFNMENEIGRLLPEPPGRPQLLPTIEPADMGEIEDAPGSLPAVQSSPAPAPQAQEQDPGMAERKAAILKWMQAKWYTNKDELEQRGAQARLFEYLEGIGLRTTKSHISDTWREILGRKGWQDVDPDAGWEDVGPNQDW